VDSLDVPAHARRFGLSLEEAARDCRYRFLRSVAESVGAAAVAVGHHADDQAETVLHRLVRGTGWRGLAGMPACRALAPDSPVMLIRPLLELHRAEIRAYLKARRLRFRDDRSNARLRHARNRIRERLMPLLARDFNPRAADALLRLAAQARQLSDLIERLADQAEISIHRRNGAALPPAVSAPPPVSASGAVRFSYAAFAALPEIVRAEVIRRAVERLGAGLREIGHERLGAAVRTLSGGRGGRRVQLPGGITVVRRGREVIVCAQGE
jgi:tRNA(Ile)-lysidine synthase